MNKEKLQNLGDAQALYRDLRRRLDPIRTISKAAPVISFDNGGDGLPLKELKVDIQPVQDLHGYSKPWAGGCGKNLAMLDADEIKSRYSFRTWINDSYDASGITWTLIKDDGGNIVGLKANGTATDDSAMHIIVNVAGNYKFTGCPSGGSASTYNVYMWDGTTNARPKKWDGTTASVNSTSSDVFQEVQIADDHVTYIACRVMSGVTVSDIIFKPMVCVSTEEDLTFEPYSNICPISGFSGVEVTRARKNLFSDAITSGLTINTDGSFANYSERSATSKGCAVKPETTYTLSYQGNITCGIFYYKADGSFDSYLTWASAPRTFTTPANVTRVRFSFYSSSGIMEPQLEIGSSATAYEACDANTYSIAFPTSAGTVYGGTLTVNKDGTGVLTVDRAKKIINGSETFGASAGSSPDGKQTVIFCEVSNIVQILDSIISDKLPTSSVVYDEPNGAIMCRTVTPGIAFTMPYETLGISSSATTTEKANAMKAWLADNNVTAVYKLASTTNCQLSAPQIKTLLGQNNIWADTGDILKLTYQADNHVSFEANEAKNESVSRTIDYPSDVLRLYDAAENLPVKKMKIEIEPVQDLHGYDKPWVGGAGKNLLPISLESMKTTSTAGTWSGDVYSRYGVSLSVVKDNDGNIIGVNANGTSTDIVFLGWIVSIKAGSYIISSNVSNSNCSISLRNNVGGEVLWNASAVGTETRSFTVSSDTNNVYVNLRIASGVSLSDVKFYPMIRLSTVTDATFEPYSNICPISGYTGCEIVRAETLVIDPTDIEPGNIESSGQDVDTYSGQRCRSNFVPVKENTKYTLRYSHTSDAYCGIFYYYDNNVSAFVSYETWGTQPRVFTTPANAKYVRFSWQSGTFPTNVDLRTDNTAKYQISFPSPTPGTVYGGTLTLNEDGSGELIVDRKQYALPLSGWTLGTAGFWANMPEDSFPGINASQRPAGTCSHYELVTKLAASEFKALDNVISYNHDGLTAYKRMFIRCSRFATASAFEEYLSGQNSIGTPVTLVYALDEPIAYPLSVDQVKLLLGYNKIYASTGDILEATYYKDVPMAYELDDVRKLFASLLPAAGNSF